MAKEEGINLEQLKERGLTCGKLKSLEKRQRKDSETFRKVGFSNIANIEEQTAEQIKKLRQRVCLLR